MGTTRLRRAGARRRSDGVPHAAAPDLNPLTAGVGALTLIDRLRAVGAEHYHDRHPFHQRLVAGDLSREQLQGWVANRYYYQKIIPTKDAAILSFLPTPEYRRVWLQRILDHDGAHAGDGGTQSWLALAKAVGLDEDEVRSERAVAAGTRFAADAYVHFARTRPWLESVASSLTEMFGPPVMQKRIAAIIENYPWIDRAGLAYFEERIPRAQRDSEIALDWVLNAAKSPQEQEACVRALRFKCDVLWSILDATALATGVFR